MASKASKQNASAGWIITITAFGHRGRQNQCRIKVPRRCFNQMCFLSLCFYFIVLRTKTIFFFFFLLCLYIFIYGMLVV